ncbi:MGDG synthase-domain-containing protein [Pelagophyceae sp. CCMP2097]|nr:MGDG synthase-domain-containing protein [Pelagophyceae sp. CCMP2097]
MLGRAVAVAAVFASHWTSALVAVGAGRKRTVSARQAAAVNVVAPYWRRGVRGRVAPASANADGADGADDAAATAVVAAAPAPKKKVLVLMSDTGGGHRASAQALVNALDVLFPGRVECDIVDIWTDHASWPYNNFVKYYAFVAKRPLLWRLLWFYAGFPVTRRIQELTASWQCFNRFKRCIAASKPDLVVSVHPLCQHIPLKVLKRLGKERGAARTPFATVVTDLGGAHPTWFHREADLCFVPSDNVRALATKAGLAEEQLRQHGLPLRSGFWQPEPRSKAELRSELGMKPSSAATPMALVVGGGDGVGGLSKVAVAIGEELGAAGSPATLAVICGKNAQAQAALQAYPWQPNLDVKIAGFVSNMHEWMAASDVLVTKAGPGTIAEACTRGLPCLLSSFLPGQEAGNVRFVQQNGFGLFKRRPKAIAATIRSWFGDAGKLAELRTNALGCARPKATTDIAAELGDLLFAI